MTKNRSDRNSIAGELAAVQRRPGNELAWPDTVPLPSDKVTARETMAHYTSIVVCRPADAWSPVERTRCAHLAGLLQMYSKNFRVLQDAGLLIKGERGMKPSPLLYGLEKLAGSIASHCRQLGLTSTAVQPGHPDGSHPSDRKALYAAQRPAEAPLINGQPLPEVTGPIDWVAAAKELN